MDDTSMDYIKSLIRNRMDGGEDVDREDSREGEEVVLDERLGGEELDFLDSEAKGKIEFKVKEIVIDPIVIDDVCIVSEKDLKVVEQKSYVNLLSVEDKKESSDIFLQKESIDKVCLNVFSSVVDKKACNIINGRLDLEENHIDKDLLCFDDKENGRESVEDKKESSDIILEEECSDKVQIDVLSSVVDGKDFNIINGQLDLEEKHIDTELLRLDDREIGKDVCLSKRKTEVFGLCNNEISKKENNELNSMPKGRLLSLSKDGYLLNSSVKDYYPDVNFDFKRKENQVLSPVLRDKVKEAQNLAFIYNKDRCFYLLPSGGILNYKFYPVKRNGGINQYFHFTNHDHSIRSKINNFTRIDFPVSREGGFVYGMYSNSRYYPFLGQVKKNMKYNLFLPKSYDYYILVNGKKREDSLIINLSVAKEFCNIIQISFSEFDIGDEIFLVIYCLNSEVVVHTRFEYKIHVVWNTDEEKNRIAETRRKREIRDSVVCRKYIDGLFKVPQVMIEAMPSVVDLSLKRKKKKQLKGSSSAKKKRKIN